MYGMTPMGAFFTAIFPLKINEHALCQQLQSVQKSDKQNAPARHKATQAHEMTNSFMYCQISHPPPD